MTPETKTGASCSQLDGESESVAEDRERFLYLKQNKQRRKHLVEFCLGDGQMVSV